MEERGKFKSLRQSMCVDPQGSVWLYGDGPLHRVDDPANTHEVHPTGTIPRAIRRIYCNRDGVFWLASNDRLFRIKDGAATSFQKAEGPSGLIGVLFQDHGGALWTGTYAGLSRFVNDGFVAHRTMCSRESEPLLSRPGTGAEEGGYGAVASLNWCSPRLAPVRSVTERRGCIAESIRGKVGRSAGIGVSRDWVTRLWIWLRVAGCRVLCG
jgi:ligand-binding sensor domain-containing protein